MMQSQNSREIITVTILRKSPEFLREKCGLFKYNNKESNLNQNFADSISCVVYEVVSFTSGILVFDTFLFKNNFTYSFIFGCTSFL